MGFSTSGLYNDRVYKFVTLFFLVLPLTLLIVAASLHNLYSLDAADLGVPQDQLSGSAHFGAFSACVDMSGIIPEVGDQTNVPFAVSGCHSIRPNCDVTWTFTVSGESTDIDSDLGPNWNCSQYNAFRAFLIIAIVTLGFTIVTAILSLLYDPQSRLLLWLTVGLNSFTIISAIISWAIVADHWKTQNDGGDYFKRGPAFGLVVTAFVMLVVALLMYVAVWRIESVGYSKSAKSDSRPARRLEDDVADKTMEIA